MFRSALILFFAGAAFAAGTLSEDIRISSHILGYDLKYIEVRQGHDWKNWRPLLDDVLRYFYAD